MKKHANLEYRINLTYVKIFISIYIFETCYAYAFIYFNKQSDIYTVENHRKFAAYGWLFKFQNNALYFFLDAVYIAVLFKPNDDIL